MRRTPVATAAAALFAVQAAGLAHSRAHGVSLASIETESVRPEAPGESPALTESPAAEILTTGNPLWAIPISRLSATRDRPVFSPSRRPREPAVAPAPAPAPVAAKAPPFALVGTIIGKDSRIAIFLNENSRTATGVREGGRTNGWTLRSVEPRSTILEESGRTVTLGLPEPAGPQVSETPIKRGRAPGSRDGL